MKYSDDPEAYRAAVEAKMHPIRIRATLGFAGLYQITYELLKVAVLDKVHEFYCTGFNQQGLQYDEHEYKTKVLALAPKKPFKASLLWLVDSEAITSAQADRLDAVYAHRHEVTHELLKYIVDLAFEPDIELLTDALVILKAIERFWIGVEADNGTFDDLEDVDLDQVASGSSLVLQQCIDAYVAGLEDNR